MLREQKTFFKRVGACPICNGDVIKTGRGWKCACGFSLPNIVANRYLADWEVEVLLSRKRILLDGFASKDMVSFPSVLYINEKGEYNLDSKVGTCPKCGGFVHVGRRAYNCSNYSAPNILCNFSIWRSISGHDVTVDEVQDILKNGFSTKPLEFFREDGALYTKHVGLTPDKSGVMKL